jgi:NAD-specific glutamate dehydrogenase
MSEKEKEEEKEDINQLKTEALRLAKSFAEAKKEAMAKIEQLRLYGKHWPQYREETEQVIEELEAELNRPIMEEEEEEEKQ